MPIHDDRRRLGLLLRFLQEHALHHHPGRHDPADLQDAIASVHLRVLAPQSPRDHALVDKIQRLKLGDPSVTPTEVRHLFALRVNDFLAAKSRTERRRKQLELRNAERITSTTMSNTKRHAELCLDLDALPTELKQALLSLGLGAGRSSLPRAVRARLRQILGPHLEV